MNVRFGITGFPLWIGVAASAVALALGSWFWPTRMLPEPPLPALDGADEEVVEIIQQAREKVLRDRKSSSAWGHLGEVLLAHTFNREANLCFQQAELLDPHEPAWPYLQGLDLSAYDPEASIPCLERAVRCCSPRQVLPRLLLAQSLLERGRLDEGQSLLDQVRAADPGNPRACLLLGRLEILRQNWQAGLTHLEACRNDVHTRKRSATLRAEIWSQLGETEKARAEQRRAAELPEDQPWEDPYSERVTKLQRGLRARFISVDYLTQSGRILEALQLLKQTVEKYPSSLEGWMRLGEAWHRVQNPDQALQCFRKATRLAPDLAEAWFRLGCIQAQIHSPEAAESFRQAIHCKPHYSQAHYNLGQCLKERGQREDAAAEFREALRCRPDYDLARAALRELDADKGKK